MPDAVRRTLAAFRLAEVTAVDLRGVRYCLLSPSASTSHRATESWIGIRLHHP